MVRVFKLFLFLVLTTPYSCHQGPEPGSNCQAVPMSDEAQRPLANVAHCTTIDCIAEVANTLGVNLQNAMRNYRCCIDPMHCSTPA